MKHRVLVLGVGNAARGDDAAGILAAGELERAAPPDTHVTCDGQVLWDIAAGTMAVDLLVVIDAASANDELPCGACRRIEFPRDADAIVNRLIMRNTHELDCPLLLKLSQQIGTLPPLVWIYAVGARNFTAGAELSAPLAEALPGIVTQIRADIESQLP